MQEIGYLQSVQLFLSVTDCYLLSHLIRNELFLPRSGSRGGREAKIVREKVVHITAGILELHNDCEVVSVAAEMRSHTCRKFTLHDSQRLQPLPKVETATVECRIKIAVPRTFWTHHLGLTWRNSLCWRLPRKASTWSPAKSHPSLFCCTGLRRRIAAAAAAEEAAARLCARAAHAPSANGCRDWRPPRQFGSAVDNRRATKCGTWFNPRSAVAAADLSRWGDSMLSHIGIEG